MTSYLFLDGACLRSRVRQVAERYCGGQELNINWWGPSAGFRKVFYYDAVPTQKPNETAEDYAARKKPIEDLHSYLATFDRFRVNEGDTRYRSGRGQEQKKVDVMIAVDMMIHTIRRNMSEAALLAGDVDFKPLLDALVNEGMFVTLIYPPGATSKELLAAADARRAMDVRTIYGRLTPGSQASFGVLPGLNRVNHPQVENCAHILTEDPDGKDLRIWHNLPDDTLTLTWRDDNAYNQMTGGSWLMTRMIAEDDHGLALPAELPADYQHL